jgi:hypothetical protein
MRGAARSEPVRTRRLLAALVTIIGFAQPAHLANAQPTIEFASVPAVGFFDPLQGRALNVVPSGYRVAVFINVFGWWTKPSWTAPLTPIQSDGTWTCNIATGGSDECATQVAAFLVPASYSPPLLGGQSQLPPELDQNAVAKLTVNRAPLARTFQFAGYTWAVKSTGICQWGPGPNYYSDNTNNVWLDAQARLHLHLTHRGNAWQCAEVALRQSLGYGTYQFLLETPADQFDPNVVLGFFTWSDDPAFDHREIDIEFSKWSDPTNPNNAQFVVQPFSEPQHLLAFREPAGVPTSTHVVTWEPSRVSFQSLRGFDPYTSGIARVIRQWTFTNTSQIPPASDETAHINLWLFNSVPPLNGQDVEVLIHGFVFTPASPQLAVVPASGGLEFSWPAGYSGFLPETAPAPLGPWSPSGITPNLVGGYFHFVLPSTQPMLFVRLRN